MTESLEERFQNLHEFVTQARTNLNRNNWDYLIGASETETTIFRKTAAVAASKSADNDAAATIAAGTPIEALTAANKMR